jgi:hypothetical protein
MRPTTERLVALDRLRRELQMPSFELPTTASACEREIARLALEVEARKKSSQTTVSMQESKGKND